MVDQYEILKIIISTAIAFLAIYGTFVIFRLQWLRKEIDDYRNRVIRLITLGSENEEDEYNRIRQIAIEQQLYKTPEELFDYNDKQFFHHLKRILGLKKDERDETYYVKDLSHGGGYQETRLSSCAALFFKRYQRMRDVHELMSLAVTFFIFTFGLSIMQFAGIEILDFSNPYNFNFFCYFFVVYVAIIFFLTLVEYRSD